MGGITSKRSAFGGDDGVIFVDLDFAENLLALARDGRIAIELTPDRAKTAVPDRLAAARAAPPARSGGDPPRRHRRTMGELI